MLARQPRKIELSAFISAWVYERRSRRAPPSIFGYYSKVVCSRGPPLILPRAFQYPQPRGKSFRSADVESLLFLRELSSPSRRPALPRYPWVWRRSFGAHFARDTSRALLSRVMTALRQPGTWEVRGETSRDTGSMGLMEIRSLLGVSIRGSSKAP